LARQDLGTEEIRSCASRLIGEVIVIRSRRRRAEPADSPDQVLGQLIEEHSDAMYRVAVSVVRDQYLAEDVVQEAVIKAWAATPDWRGDGSMRSWLLSITHNTAVSMLRRIRDEARPPEAMPESVSTASIEDESAGRATMAMLAAALDQLDPLSRSIVVLRDVEGLSYQQIGESLGVSMATVKTRLLRARRELQQVIETARREEASA